MMKPVDRIDFAYSLFVDQYNKYGPEEVRAAIRVLQSGRLFFPIGSTASALEDRLAAEFSVEGCSLVSSGTAAVHVALGAVGVDFGDEVVTSPIADTGTVIPIFLQGAIPVFADVDVNTMMITAASVKRVLSEKTRAIVVVHYGGFPADLDPLLKLAQDANIALIEDCAQSPATVYRGRRAGTIGDVGCFSVNDTKHVSCGDGGIVLAKQKETARKARLFRDKGYDRATQTRDPELVAPNYRMTELQAAVLGEQWTKLADRVTRREKFARSLDAVLEPIDSLRAFQVHPADRCSYFSYLFSVSSECPISRDEICRVLCEHGIPARPGNLYRVLYQLRIFSTAMPKYMGHFRHPEYCTVLCPDAEKANASTVRLEMLEVFGDRERDAFEQAMRRLFGDSDTSAYGQTAFRCAD